MSNYSNDTLLIMHKCMKYEMVNNVLSVNRQLMSNYSSDTLLIMHKCMKYEMGK
jgi:hypothetical protein